MIHYRLLRDNKETGPYTEEEMIAKGFKPYDLIWAEGKSAGWQYPSEINVFKKYAPIVEEQPYDRFYKKQPAQKLFIEENLPATPRYTPPAANRTYEPLASSAAPQRMERPVYQTSNADLPARHIHVTLPSGNTINLTNIVDKKESSAVREPVARVTADRPSVQAPAPSIKETRETSIPVTASRKETVTTTTVSAEPGYKKPSTIDYAPASSSRATLPWTLILGSVIGIATLVGLGIMIGLSMGKDKNEIAFNAAMHEKEKQHSPVVKAAAPAVVETPATLSPINQPVAQHTVAPNKNKELLQNAVVKTTLAADNSNSNSNAIKEDRKPAASEKNEIVPKDNHDKQEVAVSHPVMAHAANIEKNLTLTSNDFKTGAFGGISNLRCTLFNGSKLPLESVEVEVDYVQANSKVFKTEKLLFKDILAGAAATLEAPASSRGVKIVSRIVKVNAREPLSNTTAKS